MGFNLRAYMMPPRADWKAIGPRLPPWFIEQLHEVDPELVLQFMPPRDMDPEGVKADDFPNGLWAICRRMPRTGWLHKRWVMGLFDCRGNHLHPSPEIIKQVRRARDHWRRQNCERLEEEFDLWAKRIQQSREDTSRQRALEGFAGAMRRHNWTQFGGRRIRVPGYEQTAVA